MSSKKSAPPPICSQAWWDWKSYNFDTWYCSEPTAQYQVLAWVNVFCILILMVLFTVTGSLADKEGIDFWLEMAWMSWGQLFDGVGGSPDGELWGTRFVGLVNTFMGMFVFGLVCAFVEDAINSKLEALRRGKSRILEDGFDMIIGWNPRILPLVQQLCLANESDNGGVVVILSEMDKPEMDDFWMGEMPAEDRLGTKIITRQGQAIETFNLEKCSARLAKSITILAPDPHSPDESDAQVTRIMLALTGKLGVPGENGISGHVVVELCDVDNQKYVALAIDSEEVKRTYVKSMVAHDLTGRLMIQCALQPGLAKVFSHILAFTNNEFYFKQFPELSRRRFADVCFMFEDAVPFGIHLKHPVEVRTASGETKTCRIMINPPGDQLLDQDDEIIVIAEDDDSFKIGDLNMVDPRDVPDFQPPEEGPVSMLLVGFRRDLDDMINEIDKWVPSGSTLTSFATQDPQERLDILMDGGLETNFTNMQFVQIQGNPVIMRHLEEKLDIPSYDAIIVLTESLDPDGNPLIPLNCDSRTLVTTLLIRDIQKKAVSSGSTQSLKTLVCEILDPRTEKLLSLAKLDDFLSANDLVSMALGQVAKESDIHGLLEDIFCPEGDEMHIKDIRFYAHEGEYLNWWEITARARMRGEVAMGFIKPEISKEPILNPGNESQAGLMKGWGDPFTKKTRLTWKYGDQLVVFSMD
jgi:hypothetical protein